ncbi:STAS domain-containing protein [Neobacillus sp. YIM B06451]|uniref:STAS domain-containing protein n=1 Tax=Neobacillus sp. YIM B06451 TaxID=3070994 RepID=UPI0029305FC4|nr:STAS domain-containing protein [Neobacillus sp. YIM B06451]
MRTRIIEILNEHRERLLADWKIELHHALPKPEYTEGILATELFDIIFESIKKVDTDSSSDLSAFYSKLMDFNGSLNFLTYGFQGFRRIALKTLLQEDLTKEEVLQVYYEIDRWFDPIISQVVNDCSNDWENALSQQQQTIQELSAPAIQLFDHIIVMPLVGNINERRATTIMESLLRGIEKHKAEIVFLDVSGVPTIDTFVAQSLMNSTTAARLLGTECMIVGMRPEIAQTIIGLGINLSEIKTFGSLNSGLMYAMKELNLHK